jgi:hypothetical protein
MSKRHHATRRRSYGRRQHELHQRDELTRRATWTEASDPEAKYDLAFRAERALAHDVNARWTALGDRD